MRDAGNQQRTAEPVKHYRGGALHFQERHHDNNYRHVLCKICVAAYAAQHAGVTPITQTGATFSRATLNYPNRKDEKHHSQNTSVKHGNGHLHVLQDLMSGKTERKKGDRFIYPLGDE
jgi:hypothetical protein